ncbi:MAG TPA: hypothetical protein VK048_03765 [Atopostipes sp.]|nr:hypothetical protein [Atopostipes sp.]
MKRYRYPLLFIAVLIVPAICALLMPDDVVSIPGYLLGYLMIYGLTTAINHYSKETIYSKNIRILYPILNVFVVFLLVRTLGMAVMVLYMVYVLNPLSAALLIIVPWVLVQMLVLYFFVRYENRASKQ